MSLEAGKHDVTVLSSGLSFSAKSKAGQIVIQFGNENGEITAYLATSEKAWPYTEEKLRILGWDAELNGYDLRPLNSEESPIIGAPASITVQQETFEGKARLKVAFINAPGGGFERMSDDDAARFSATLRARITGQPLPNKSNRPAKRAEPSPEEDGDIPF